MSSKSRVQSRKSLVIGDGTLDIGGTVQAGMMISRRDAGVAEMEKVLEVTVEAIKISMTKTAVNIIANTVNSHDQSALVFINPIINPVKKWLQAIEENKKLYPEKIALYELMLGEKDQMIEELKN